MCAYMASLQHESNNYDAEAVTTSIIHVIRQ